MASLYGGRKVTKTVLVFDSGVGGLSVYEEIRRALPGLHYLYVFDNARFPYGELPESELVARCCQVIGAAIARHRVDLVVIACNTASTHVLPSLRAQLSIPVVGVVPAIKPAAALTRTGCIGLLATPGTVSRPYTHRLIREFAADKQVLLCGTTELVIQAERKLAGSPVEQALIDELLCPWRSGPQRPDTLVLGCTHFPLLKREIDLALPGCLLVDSGAAVARRVGHLLGPLSAGATDAAPKSWVYCTRDDAAARRLTQALLTCGLGELQPLPV